VALVSGNMKASVRERIFAGFNTPLLPEVLVCTAVGQEGIDLHPHSLPAPTTSALPLPHTDHQRAA
jgi:hypothetical protein